MSAARWSWTRLPLPVTMTLSSLPDSRVSVVCQAAHQDQYEDQYQPAEQAVPLEFARPQHRHVRTCSQRLTVRATDCYEKRGKRGYLFLIGDEMAYPRVKASEARAVTGDGLQSDLPLTALMAEVTRRWDTYYILPAGASYVGDTEVLGFWRTLLGQNVIELTDTGGVCETIALTIGLGEDAVDLAEGVDDLGDMGSAAGPAVSRALAGIGAGHARLELAATPDDLGGPSGNDRL